MLFNDNKKGTKVYFCSGNTLKFFSTVPEPDETIENVLCHCVVFNTNSSNLVFWVSIVVDIQTISIAIASASVVAGVVYYAFQVRHQTKIRQTDLVIRLSSYVVRRDFLEAVVDILDAEFEDYGDFVRKYGKPFSKKQIPMSFLMVGNFCEQLGVLFRNKLIDISLISQLFTVPALWKKMRPIIEGIRKEEHNQGYYEWFENLYRELKKREQKL
jgi:hypothetical protein